MEKLSMCRICLVENVRMYVVANKNLQEIYEKLTDIPFVTEDSRPMLACFFCCIKLKQSCQLQRKCMEAENLLVQMLNEDYQPNSLLNQGVLEFCSGFIITPTVHISIFDECQAESDYIKEELPDVCEGEDNIIEPKEEHRCDELELDYQDIEYLDSFTDQEDNMVPDNSELEDIPSQQSESEDIPPHQSELEDIPSQQSESEDIPPHQSELEVIPSQQSESEDIPPHQSELEDIPSHQSESDSFIHSEWCDGIFFRPDYIPSLELQTEVEREQEVSMEKRKAKNTERPTVAKKPRKAKLEDTITAEQNKNQPSDSNFIRTVRNRASNYVTRVKELVTTANTTVTHCNIDESKEKLNKPNIIELTNNLSTAIDTNCRRNSSKDNLVRKIRNNNKGINSVGINRLQTLYKEKHFKCDVCSREFTTKCNLKRHIYIHTSEKPYKCYVCRRSFADKYYCKIHIRTHTDGKPYKCNVCQRSFTHENSCNIHIRTHTGEKPYKCDVCQRSFSHKYSLIYHIRTHTGETPYKCEICYRLFTQKIHLSDHILTHTGEKPYKCDICQHSFIKKYNLKNHIQTHTGKKPYKCDVCQHSFALKEYLTKHTRNHTGEKHYKCEICQRRFNLKGVLDRHILTHAAEKPYKCDVCRRSFAQKKNLNKHFQTHIGAKPYK